MATGRRPPGGPDIPDLDLGAPRPGPPASAPTRTSGAPARSVPAPPPTPVRGPEDYFGTGTFDADHFADSSVTIALDTGDDPPVTGDPSGYLGGGSIPEDVDAGDLDLYEGSTAHAQAIQSVPVPAPDRRKWPTGTSPDALSLRIDAAEVALAADYGPAPESVLTAPVYAVRVLSRKRAIGAKLKELSEAFEQARRKRDELLMGMVQDLRGKILMAEQGDTLFEPIVAVERVALERRSALAGTSAEYDARAADLAERSRTIDHEVAEQRAIIGQRTAALAELVRSFERADAKKKRLYIELGGLVRISEKTGGKLTGEQSASITRLEAEIATQKPDLEAAARAVEASKALLARAEDDEEKIAGKARETDRLRRALDLEFQKQIGARNEGVTEADEQRRLAFADLGRHVLAERGKLVDVGTEILDAIARADQMVLDRATDLEKHVRARDAYDAEALKKGIGIGVLVVAILVITLMVLAIR